MNFRPISARLLLIACAAIVASIVFFEIGAGAIGAKPVSSQHIEHPNP